MTDRELLNCLTDRPCDVCKFHGENGCSQWVCVFCDGLFGDMRTKQESRTEIETWNGYHGQITASKGTFEKIWNDAKKNGGEI